MDRMQIGLKLGMDVLGIPLNVDNYQKICDAVYLAGQRGIHISPARVEFNPKKCHAYSPLHRDTCIAWSRNLYTDIKEIEEELKDEKNDSSGWCLGKASIDKLESLRKLIQKKGMEKLLAESS